MAPRRCISVRISVAIGATLCWISACQPGFVLIPLGGDGPVVPGSSVGTDSGNGNAGEGSNTGGLTPGPGGTGTEASCEAIGQPVDAVHAEMYRVLNAYRTNNRLPALAYSKTLEAAADAHARDMWQRGFFEHENPDGDGPGERALAAGFCHEYVGENIAEGDGLATVAEVQAGWVASPGHNANMLNEPYRLVGMGHYYDPMSRYHYWVQDFALPNP